MSNKYPSPMRGQNGRSPDSGRRFSIEVWDSRVTPPAWRVVAYAGPSDSPSGAQMRLEAPELFAGHAYLGFLVHFANVPSEAAPRLPMPDVIKTTVNLKAYTTGADPAPQETPPGEPLTKISTTAFIPIVNVQNFRGIFYRVRDAKSPA